MGMAEFGLRVVVIAESHVPLDLRTERSTGTPDDKENIHRGRHHRDLRPLVRGPLEEPARRVAGGRPKDRQKVPGAGGGRRDHPGRAADERGRLGQTDQELVPGTRGPAVESADLAGAGPAPRLHQEPAGNGHRHHDPPTSARRAQVEGIGLVLAPLGARLAAGRGGQIAGHRAARRRRAGLGGSDRLRVHGPVDEPAHRQAAPGLGIRDGAAVLAAHVRAPGAAHEPARLDRGPRRGLPVLRRLCG